MTFYFFLFLFSGRERSKKNILKNKIFQKKFKFSGRKNQKGGILRQNKRISF
jgi:hypothetical protein